MFCTDELGRELEDRVENEEAVIIGTCESIVADNVLTVCQSHEGNNNVLQEIG